LLENLFLSAFFGMENEVKLSKTSQLHAKDVNYLDKVLINAESLY